MENGNRGHGRDSAPPGTSPPGDAGAAPEGGQTRRLRLFFLVPVAIVIALVAVVSVVTGYLYANREAERQLERTRASAAVTYHHSVMHQTNVLRAAMEAVLGDEALKFALARRDREALLARAAPLLSRLKNKLGVTHFYFHAPDRTSLLRVHQPDRRGGTVDRFTLREAERTGEMAYGVELGSRGIFTLRLVAPWYGNAAGRRLLGYVELGFEIDRVIQDLEGMIHAQVFAFIFKEYVQRGPWEEGVKMLGQIPEWDRFPDAVLSVQARQALPAPVAAQFSKGLPRERSGVLKAVSGESHYLGAFVPLEDASGRVVAEMLVLLDVSSQLHAARQVVLTGSLIALGSSGGLLVFFWLLVGRVGRRVERDERALVHLATHDGLTGLYNHKTCYLMLEDEAARSRRYGTFASLLMLDIDHFKSVNDTWGHVAGDRILAELSGLVRATNRTVDKACRYGGEEIAVILPQTGTEKAVDVAERIRMTVEGHAFDVGAEQAARVTVSIGVATLPDHAHSAKDLVAAADKALYTAKEGGRNRVCRHEARAAAGER